MGNDLVVGVGGQVVEAHREGFIGVIGNEVCP
jgi:hypothetical protein